MSRRWVRTFELGFARKRVWRAWTDLGEMERWMEPTVRRSDDDRLESSSGGQPIHTEVVEVDAENRLRWRYRGDEWPDWVDVTVTFEEVGSGTRITMTHAGFGDDEAWAGVADELEGRVLGWSEAIADLAVYLETGRATLRHFSARSDLGVGVVETSAGVRVQRVDSEGVAGLRRGDLLVTVDGVAVYRRSDLWTLARARAGDEASPVPVTCVRDGKLVSDELAASDLVSTAAVAAP